MEVHDVKKKAEIESARTRLDTTKEMLEEVLDRISKTETEYNALKSQYSRKLKNLERFQGNQCLRSVKLKSDLENIEGLLQLRKTEESELQKVNAELKEEYQNLVKENANMSHEFQVKLESLDEQVKLGYKEIKNDQDAEVLLEVGLSSLKVDDKLPFIEEVLAQKRKADQLRQEKHKVDLSELEEAQRQASQNLQTKMQELALAKDKQAELMKTLGVMKRYKQDA